MKLRPVHYAFIDNIVNGMNQTEAFIAANNLGHVPTVSKERGNIRARAHLWAIDMDIRNEIEKNIERRHAAASKALVRIYEKAVHAVEQRIDEIPGLDPNNHQWPKISQFLLAAMDKARQEVSPVPDKTFDIRIVVEKFDDRKEESPHGTSGSKA